MLEIVLKTNGCFFKSSCDFCNHCFDLEEVVAILVDPSRPDEKLIGVCPTCLAAGADGIKKRCLIAAEEAAKEAQGVAEWAKSEAARAQAIQTEEIIVPTAADLDAMKRKAFHERFGDDVTYPADDPVAYAAQMDELPF